MRMTKKLFSILASALLVCVSNTNLFAQQYPVFTQYYFNELVINPAFAGAHVQLSLTTTYRNQWVNFPGAPRTFSFSGHTSLYNGKMGVGLLVNNDRIGSYDNQNVYGYYAYKVHFRDATLSMGLQAGFNFLGVDFSQLDLQDPDDPSFAPLNEFKPNFGAGIYYNRKNFFAGFSVPFILNSDLSSDVETIATNIKEARYYFLRSGAIFPITPKETVKLNPSILVRAQEGQPLSLDLNLGVVLHDVLSTGISWRSGDSIISFIDLKLSENFHFAYSYDWTSSDLRKFSNGSHEFMLNFRAKVTTKHRELNCPTYYHYR
jgi:type IX secretion system PorP/SprF family membrane protein